MALTQEQTAARMEELAAFIAENKNVAHELFGYLSMDAMTLIADELDIPVSKIYGVATFYAQFSLTPKGDNIIQVCTGTACYVKGAQAVLDEVIHQLGIHSGETTEDGKFTIQDTRCLGCCGLAPVMTINEDVYGRMVPGQVKGILDKYRAL